MTVLLDNVISNLTYKFSSPLNCLMRILFFFSLSSKEKHWRTSCFFFLIFFSCMLKPRCFPEIIWDFMIFFNVHTEPSMLYYDQSPGCEASHVFSRQGSISGTGQHACMATGKAVLLLPHSPPPQSWQHDLAHPACWTPAWVSLLMLIKMTCGKNTKHLALVNSVSNKGNQRIRES